MAPDPRRPIQDPEQRGRRLLPTLVDHLAATDPTRPFVSLPKSNDIKEGFNDVDYATFAAAINRCAYWLDQELGRPRYEFEKVTYMGPSDLRYAIFILAAVKAGYVVCHLFEHAS